MKILTLLLTFVACAISATGQTETPEQRDARMKWWTEARFGMFIHWDISSLAGTEISWSRKAARPLEVPDNGGGPAGAGHDEVYDNLYKKFDPVKFDALAWVRLAKAAGMKYIVFTAKHHGGFCMWDTKLTDYSIMHTPFHRDVVRELADACHKEGIRFGIYYSPRDWHHPDYGIGDDSKYLEYMKGQLTELLTHYGKVDVVWFDSFGVGDSFKFWHADEVLALVRKLQPQAVINNRCSFYVETNRPGLEGDFDTPEQRLGEYQYTRHWESCMTVVTTADGGGWSYRPNGTLRPFAECVKSLVSCATGDGNLLLDVGPDALGQIPSDQAGRLREMGAWMQKYGESIYGTHGGPFRNGHWGGATFAGKTVYLHIFPSGHNVFLLPALNGKLVSFKNLTGGPVKAVEKDGCICVTIPTDSRAVPETIIKLTFDSPVIRVKGEILISDSSNAGQEDVAGKDTCRGQYFYKKQYVPESLPTFDQVRDMLPEPLLPSEPEWVKMYWKCWELAFAHLKQPVPGSPLVSNWLDEWFSPNIFQWDTDFMMMFARYAHYEFPAIQSLDNFYCRQRTNGYICREYTEATGKEVKFGANGGFDDPRGWANSINPPLFAWAECETFKVTGDKSRFAHVLPVLEKYVEFLNRDGDPDAPPEKWLEQGRRSAGTPHQLYWNTDLGSGMDDIPKPTKKGAGWVDMSCQMVMQYRELAFICHELGQQEKAARYEAEAKSIGDRINKWCWNETDGFYYDVLADGTQFKKKTACGFWPMIAGIASPGQVRRMVAHLKDPNEFWRPFVFPALAADEPEYNLPTGAYWRGAVWAPTNYMIIKGLEACGQEKFATEVTEKYLGAMAEVFQKRGTVFENYMPEKIEPSSGRGDFVGWTGVGPVTLLIENVLGFRPDGEHNRLDWQLARTDRHGIKKLRFGQVTTDVIYDGNDTVNVATDKPYILVINGVEYAIPAGTSSWKVRL